MNIFRRIFGCDQSTQFEPNVAAIEKLTLKRGDVLAIMIQGSLTKEHAAKLRAAVETKLPKGVKALVVDGSARVAVIHKVEVT